MTFETYRVALFEPAQAYRALAKVWALVKPWVDRGDRLHMEIRADNRTLSQNRRLWALLNDISEQVVWHGRKLDAEAWKHVLSAGLKRQDVVPNMDGTGFVVLGVSTSKMTKAELSELMDLAEAFGTEHGVTFLDEEPPK
jgi:hypothetical protein